MVRCALALLMLIFAAPAMAQVKCYEVDSLQSTLSGKLGERLAFSGRSANGIGVVLFVAPAGNWTLAWLDPDGAACPVASGDTSRLPDGPVFIELIPEDPA